MDETIRTAAISPLRQRLIDDMKVPRFVSDRPRIAVLCGEPLIEPEANALDDMSQIDLGVPAVEICRLPVFVDPRTGETFEAGYVTAWAYPVGISNKLVPVPRLTGCRSTDVELPCRRFSRPEAISRRERSSTLAGWTYVTGCAFWPKFF